MTPIFAEMPMSYRVAHFVEQRCRDFVAANTEYLDDIPMHCRVCDVNLNEGETHKAGCEVQTGHDILNFLAGFYHPLEIVAPESPLRS